MIVLTVSQTPIVCRIPQPVLIPRSWMFTRSTHCGHPSRMVTSQFPRVGQMLTRYKSGPLPKPFKIIPSLPQWSRILALTHPENWSAQACHAATRIFTSQMKPPQARLFLEVVLLDAIREDIRLTREGTRKNKNHRKLNVHYYESLKRAMYKPGAVFKGIVFPLLNVSARLNVVFLDSERSSYAYRRVARCRKLQSLRRCSQRSRSRSAIPRPRSCGWPTWTTLVSRAHAVPPLDRSPPADCCYQARTRSSSVCYWTRSMRCRTRSSTRSSSISSAFRIRTRRVAQVTWRSSLCSGTRACLCSARGPSPPPCLGLSVMEFNDVYSSRYASDLTPDQKDALLDVIRANPHPQISPEVRRELVNSVERGAPRPDADGDITMA